MFIYLYRFGLMFSFVVHLLPVICFTPMCGFCCLLSRKQTKGEIENEKEIEKGKTRMG